MDTISIETKEHIPPVTKADVVENEERQHVAISFILKSYICDKGHVHWVAAMPALNLAVDCHSKEEAIKKLQEKLEEIDPDLEIVGLVSKDETDE